LIEWALNKIEFDPSLQPKLFSWFLKSHSENIIQLLNKRYGQSLLMTEIVHYETSEEEKGGFLTDLIMEKHGIEIIQ
jgi:hypothetical protein